MGFFYSDFPVASCQVQNTFSTNSSSSLSNYSIFSLPFVAYQKIVIINVMNIITINNIAIVNSNEIIIKDAASAVDFVMEIKGKTNCDKIALNISSLPYLANVLLTLLWHKVNQHFIIYS